MTGLMAGPHTLNIGTQQNWVRILYTWHVVSYALSLWDSITFLFGFAFMFLFCPLDSTLSSSLPTVGCLNKFIGVGDSNLDTSFITE